VAGLPLRGVRAGTCNPEPQKGLRLSWEIRDSCTPNDLGYLPQRQFLVVEQAQNRSFPLRISVIALPRQPVAPLARTRRRPVILIARKAPQQIVALESPDPLTPVAPDSARWRAVGAPPAGKATKQISTAIRYGEQRVARAHPPEEENRRRVDLRIGTLHRVQLHATAESGAKLESARFRRFRGPRSAAEAFRAIKITGVGRVSSASYRLPWRSITEIRRGTNGFELVLHTTRN